MKLKSSDDMQQREVIFEIKYSKTCDVYKNADIIQFSTLPDSLKVYNATRKYLTFAKPNVNGGAALLPI